MIHHQISGCSIVAQIYLFIFLTEVQTNQIRFCSNQIWLSHSTFHISHHCIFTGFLCFPCPQYVVCPLGPAPHLHVFVLLSPSLSPGLPCSTPMHLLLICCKSPPVFKPATATSLVELSLLTLFLFFCLACLRLTLFYSDTDLSCLFVSLCLVFLDRALVLAPTLLCLPVWVLGTNFGHSFTCHLVLHQTCWTFMYLL